MGSLYGVGYSGWSGSSGVSGTSGVNGTTLYDHSDFRLTLESGVAVSGTNQEAKTTLYLTPYIGKQICLYYGSAWNFYDSDEVSISLSGKTANKNHDVFAYYTGSAVSLELVEWTSDSVRAANLARSSGVLVKSGDATKKYIGTIRTTGTTGQCEDSYTTRYVWNWYNRVSRWGFTTNTTTSWTYSTYAWREFNGGTGQIRFKFVIGDHQTLQPELAGEVLNPTGAGYAGYSIDATNTSYGYYLVSSNILYYGQYLQTANVYLYAPGYHYATLVEICSGGTMTVYGYGSSTAIGYGVAFLLDS